MSASKGHPAQGIDELPAQTVRRLGSYDVDGLRRDAERAGHRFVHLECSDCIDKPSVLKAIGRAFAFPEWYGGNLDALFDCLTDLPERGAPGWVVVLERLPEARRFDAEEREALLEVFRDAAEALAAQGVAFRVFYA
jgi:RNAse (barnase) inhibitor barstar